MVEMADTSDLKSDFERSVGSNPTRGTKVGTSDSGNSNRL